MNSNLYELQLIRKVLIFISVLNIQNTIIRKWIALINKVGLKYTIIKTLRTYRGFNKTWKRLIKLNIYAIKLRKFTSLKID